MTRRRVITIDGPAGAGKSTVARNLAEALGFEFLDTGAMYRAVTWKVLELGVAPGDEVAVADVARAIHMDWRDDGRLVVDGQPLGDEIRSDAVTGAVSAVSANPAVRRAMVAVQRRVAEERDLVVEGRDTGSVVFPDADVRFYLDADPAERARRRADEYRSAGADPDEAAILESIVARDRADSTRSDSPLVQVEGMEYVNSTGHSRVEVIDLLRRKVVESLS